MNCIESKCQVSRKDYWRFYTEWKRKPMRYWQWYERDLGFMQSCFKRTNEQFQKKILEKEKKYKAILSRKAAKG